MDPLAGVLNLLVSVTGLPASSTFILIIKYTVTDGALITFPLTVAQSVTTAAGVTTKDVYVDIPEDFTSTGTPKAYYYLLP